MTTKIYFDAEFTGLHKKTTLISLGMVSDCGKTFYAEFADYTKSQVDTWLEKNVMNNLRFRDRPNFQINAGNDFMIKHHTVKITELLEKWLAQFRSIEMWGDTLAYDWVLFCDLFGSGMALPRNISYIPLDIATVFYQKGIDPDISREKFAYGEVLTEMKKHNALWDAETIKICHQKLLNL